MWCKPGEHLLAGFNLIALSIIGTIASHFWDLSWGGFIFGAGVYHMIAFLFAKKEQS